MPSTRAQRFSLTLALVLTLGLLWGAVLRLDGARAELEERVEAEARRRQELNERLAGSLASADRKQELLETVDLARSVAEAQRNEARHGLFLAHLEAAERALATGRLDDFDRHAARVPEEHRGWAFRYLQRRRAEVLLELRHASEITVLAGRPGGEAWAAGDAGGTVRVYDSAGKIQGVLDVGDEISALALEVGTKRLAVGTDSGALEIWDHGLLELLERRDLEETPTAIAFRPASTELFVGLFDGTTLIWDRSGEPRPLAQRDGPVNALAVSSDGTLLATCTDDPVIHLLRAPNFDQPELLEGHTDWVVALAFDGQRLLSGSDDRTTRHYHVARGSTKREPFSDSVVAVAFDAQGKSLCVTADGVAVSSGGRLGLPLPDGHYVEHAVLGIGGRSLAYSTGDESVWLTQPLTLDAPPLWLPDDVRTLDVSGGGTTLAAGSTDGRVRIIDRTGAVVRELDTGDELAPPLSLTSDGSRIATGGRGRVQVWDTTTGELRAALVAGEARIQSLGISDDGLRVCATSGLGEQWTWSVDEGALLHGTPRPQGFVFTTRALRASLFSWVGDAGTIRVWDARTGERRAALRERSLGRVDAMALAPGGRHLVVISNDHELASFDLTESRMLAQRRDATRAHRVLALHPSGDRFVTGAEDGAVIVWDQASCTPLLELVQRGQPATAMCFDPTGDTLFVLHADGALRSFEAAP